MANPMDTETALHQLEDKVIKIAEDMKVDPTPLALYLILKDLRTTARKDGTNAYTISLIELGMIDQLKAELNDAGL